MFVEKTFRCIIVCIESLAADNYKTHTKNITTVRFMLKYRDRNKHSKYYNFVLVKLNTRFTLQNLYYLCLYANPINDSM